jgi:hypothetical protein
MNDKVNFNVHACYGVPQEKAAALYITSIYLGNAVIENAEVLTADDLSYVCEEVLPEIMRDLVLLWIDTFSHLRCHKGFYNPTWKHFDTIAGDIKVHGSPIRERDYHFFAYLEKDTSCASAEVDVYDLKLVKNEGFDEEEIQRIFSYLTEEQEQLRQFALTRTENFKIFDGEYANGTFEFATRMKIEKKGILDKS